MQIAQGEPADLVGFGCSRLSPIAGRALWSKGTSMVIWRRNFPSPSKTWIRRLPRSAT